MGLTLFYFVHVVVFTVIVVINGVYGGIGIVVFVIIVVTCIFPALAVVTGVNVVVLTWLYLLLLLSHGFLLI